MSRPKQSIRKRHASNICTRTTVVSERLHPDLRYFAPDTELDFDFCDQPHRIALDNLARYLSPRFRRLQRRRRSLSEKKTPVHALETRGKAALSFPHRFDFIAKPFGFIPLTAPMTLTPSAITWKKCFWQRSIWISLPHSPGANFSEIGRAHV